MILEWVQHEYIYRVWYALPQDINHLFFFLGGGDVYPPCLGTASWESQGKNQTFPNANGHPLKKNSRPYLRDHDKATAPQSLNNPLVIMFSRMFINPLIIP